MKLICLALIALAFAFCDANSSCRSVSLSSNGYNFKSQDIQGMGTITYMIVTNKRSKSACIYGFSFGFSGNTIWVDKGCRATFRICSGTVNTTVRCESKDYRFENCYAGGYIHDISVKNQLSRSTCLLDFSYRASDSFVSVLRGCRAIFNVTIR